MPRKQSKSTTESPEKVGSAEINDPKVETWMFTQNTEPSYKSVVSHPSHHLSDEWEDAISTVCKVLS